jgi:hypothetical protein
MSDFETIFENKKVYLLKRINEENVLLEKFRAESYDNELNYVLKQSRDRFFFSAPEIVDYCFDVLSKYLSLNRDLFENPPLKKNGMILNCYGEPIVCLKCKGRGHVSVSCKNK